MKKTALVLAMLAAAGFSSAQAQNYQMEAEVGYTDTDLNDDSIFDASFVYHLAPVATAGLPLAEAAFLTYSSNFGIGYATFDDADVDTIGVQGEVYFDKVYIRAGYSSTGGDDLFADVDTISGRIGYVVLPGLRLAAGVNRVDVDAPGVEESNDIVIEGKYVTKLAGDTAVNLEAALTMLDEADDEVIEISGDYYFNHALSVGAGASFADDDDNYGVNARYFFTPKFSGQLQYVTVNDGDDDSIRVSAALRF
ncbi:MAG TPA: putative porin [Fontimonas sp.]